MKTVPLHGMKAAGRVALVDDEDYDLVMQHRWNLVENTTPGERSGPYARASWTSTAALFMHQLIVDYPKPDHVDGNGLNNQRSNLRPATASQNCINRRTWGRSAYRGVCWNRAARAWSARIGYEGKQHFLGNFKSEEEAALAYDTAAIRIHGAFARLNFSDAA